MKDKILKLRSEGKTYNEIQKILGCSKSVISYHCGAEQKEKSKERNRNWKKKNPIKIKLSAAKTRLRKKINDFKRRVDHKNGVNFFGSVNSDINPKDVQQIISSFQDNPICYLTGRKLDFLDSKSFHLDHKIPMSKGGTNNLDNLGFACREANTGKGNLSLEEFIEMCKDVLKHHGYEIKTGN